MHLLYWRLRTFRFLRFEILDETTLIWLQLASIFTRFTISSQNVLLISVKKLFLTIKIRIFRNFFSSMHRGMTNSWIPVTSRFSSLRNTRFFYFKNELCLIKLTGIAWETWEKFEIYCLKIGNPPPIT